MYEYTMYKNLQIKVFFIIIMFNFVFQSFYNDAFVRKWFELHVDYGLCWLDTDQYEMNPAYFNVPPPPSNVVVYRNPLSSFVDETCGRTDRTRHSAFILFTSYKEIIENNKCWHESSKCVLNSIE
jgi:hypothetical protein